MARRIITLLLALITTISLAYAQIPSENEIWYTTTDGKKISFNANDLVLNSYNNGRGVLKFRDRVTRIGRSAFEGCSNLTSITIPNGVTSIGEWAFYGCSRLKSVKISNKYCYDYFKDKVANIAFYGAIASDDGRCLIIGGKLERFIAKGITEYTIPESVTSIGSEAFEGCSSLKSITIPNSVTEIGSSAFLGCSSLTSITIPNSVTSIGEKTFQGCSSLTSITIPNSVTSIEWKAFDGCSNLKSITIPNSVTSIGEFAFEDCSSLKSITIPNSVKSIGSGAFYGCSSLTNTTIPKSVTSFGDKVFSGCTGLLIINCNIPDTTWMVLYEGAPGWGHSYLHYEYPLQGSEFSEIIISESVTSIGNLAFRYCSNLTSITIGNGVTRIGDEAFSGCSNLKSVKVSNKYCYDYFKDEVDDIAFYGANASDDGRCLIVNGELKRFIAKGITEYTIPESVTSIDSYAFEDCSSLKSVKVSNKYCYDYFKDKVANIAFYEANASADGRCLIVNGELQLFIGKGVTQYSIPESVTSIGEYAFDGCSSLTSITIPESVTSIGQFAFVLCSSLKSITIPNSVTSIGDWAFNDCSSLTSITIGNSVTSIGEFAFYRCSSLTSITIPNSVTSIGTGAFYGCSSLKSVKVSNKYCYDYFKDKVANIAFYGANASADGRCLIIDGKLERFIAKGITEYTISNSVTSIGDYAFDGCSSLKSVKVSNEYCYDYFKDKVANIAFYGANASADGRCLIIDGELSIFIADELTEYAIPEGVTKIGSGVFYGCSNLTSIVIPNSVTEIGESAFYGCSGLTSLTIPEGVTQIGENALNCFNLTSLTCLAMTPPAIQLLGITEKAKIYVPKEAIKFYKDDPNWSRYAKQIKRIK